MELLKFHVKIPTNQARDPTGGLRVDESIPAKGAGVKEAVGGPVRIAIDVVEPKGVTTTVVPDNSHQAGPQDFRDHGNAAAPDNGGEQAGAISLGFGQEHLATGLPDDAKDGLAFPHPSLLDQGNVPLQIGQIGPALGKAGQIGGDNDWPGVSGFPNAEMGPTINAMDAGVPRRGQGTPEVEPKWSHVPKGPQIPPRIRLHDTAAKLTTNVMGAAINRRPSI
jgi:hypothetical protein